MDARAHSPHVRMSQIKYANARSQRPGPVYWFGVRERESGRVVLVVVVGAAPRGSGVPSVHFRGLCWEMRLCCHTNTHRSNGEIAVPGESIVFGARAAKGDAFVYGCLSMVVRVFMYMFMSHARETKYNGTGENGR